MTKGRDGSYLLEILSWTLSFPEINNEPLTLIFLFSPFKIHGKARMLRKIQILLGIFFVFAFGILYEFSHNPGCLFSCLPISKKFPTFKGVMSQGNSIIFLETTDRLDPPPLVSCSVESTARIYHDRPIVFFMKGLKSNIRWHPKNTSTAFSLLSAIKNVFIVPLQMETLLQKTPLLSWYHKVNETLEKNWIHISSDASRLAIIWKYGGLYMDTDIISIRPIPVKTFIAAQASKVASNGIFSFPRHHSFIWNCMKNFVENYNADIWGHQGPYLMTRVLKTLCNLTDFKAVEDQCYQNIFFLNPQRFYPIPYPLWEKYYEVWDLHTNFSDSYFSDSYALHLWNYMNQQQKAVVAGSNTLAENLYKTYCPITYKNLILDRHRGGCKRE
ncbi:PREDICTED: alpha-1,4-N-acetylglucosaminyltransferase [Crocodylus porosus]|nr:PREDICTED: alpha-1,4-N-acetylglucosaminyltransferase [Crocodylus porosus]